MQLYSGTGVTSKSDIRAEKPIQAIGFIVTGAAVALSERITVRKISSQGKVRNIIVDGKIRDLCIINAIKEGFFMYATTYAHATIDLSEKGSVALDTDEYIDVKITGMTSGDTWNVYGIETPVLSHSTNVYDRQFIPVGQGTKEIDVRDAHILAVQAANLTEVQISYKSGTGCIYTPNEMKLLSYRLNDLVFQDGTGAIQAGYYLFYVIDVTDASKVRITQDSTQSTEFYVVSSEN